MYVLCYIICFSAISKILNKTEWFILCWDALIDAAGEGWIPSQPQIFLEPKAAPITLADTEAWLNSFIRKPAWDQGLLWNTKLWGRSELNCKAWSTSACVSPSLSGHVQKRYTKDMTDLYTIVMELSLEAPEFLTSSQVKQKAQANAQPLRKSPPALGPAQPALGPAQPQCKAWERWSAKIHV